MSMGMAKRREQGVGESSGMEERMENKKDMAPRKEMQADEGKPD